MGTELERVRERMAEYLNEHGVRAVTAWPGEARPERDGPVVAVSLRGCRAAPAGLKDYLGERYDPASGMWEEVYGRKAVLTLGLDLYAPAKGAGADVQDAFDTLAQALLLGGPDGLEIQEFSCGETDYDQRNGLLKRSAQAVCGAWLCRETRTGEVFLDFDLRGGWNE